MLQFNVGNVKLKLYFGFFAAVMLYYYLMNKDRYCISASLISCFLHETGHLSAMLLFGCPPDEVYFYFGGIRIKPSHTFTARRKMTVILLAGCIVNFVLCAVSRLLGLEDMYFINLALGIFNLMPFKALDGGHVLALYGLENFSRVFSIILIVSSILLLFAYRAFSPMAVAVVVIFALSEFCL